jgi:hypothetical protein
VRLSSSLFFSKTNYKNDSGAGSVVARGRVLQVDVMGVFSGGVPAHYPASRQMKFSLSRWALSAYPHECSAGSAGAPPLAPSQAIKAARKNIHRSRL